jgi:ADP-ribosylglycohydrolase
MERDREPTAGCLLGMAAGDALGTPLENLSPRRGRRLFPSLDQHRFLLGRGMCSDDTEHACMVGQALLTSGGFLEAFTRSLARRLRWWLVGIPAGIGLATLKACLKLWVGVSPDRSGVFSAGNGPAMRSPILGVCLGDSPDRLRAFVRASTRITHSDPKAEIGAFAAAWAAHRSAETRTGSPPTPAMFVSELREHFKADDTAAPFLASLDKLVEYNEAGRSTEEYAAALALGRGVTGYIYHTVPVALYAWLRYPDDFRAAVEGVIRCGGDTDTVAGITGALVGARLGKAGIPSAWLSGIAEWPRSVSWIEGLADSLAAGQWRVSPQPAKPLAVWAIPARNLVFFVVVLAHVARRMLPPY